VNEISKTAETAVLQAHLDRRLYCLQDIVALYNVLAIYKAVRQMWEDRETITKKANLRSARHDRKSRGG